MKITNTTPTTLDTEARSLRALLDDCRHGPWPVETYGRLAVVDRLRARRDELTIERADALAAASAADAAETDAVVDGRDTVAAAAEAAEQRQSAERLARALDTLALRSRAAALDVLTSQGHELLRRAVAAGEAVHEQQAQRAAGIEHLATIDGEHWRRVDDAAPGWAQRGQGEALKVEAAQTANLVLAVRATIDDVPLGFPGVVIGWGAPAVSHGGLGTLAGVPGVPPLIDVDHVTGEAALSVDGAAELLAELRAQLP